MAVTRTVILTIVFAWCTLLGVTRAQERDSQSMKLYWIFLTTGRSTDGVSADDVRKMQQAHLANFGRLAREGKLLTAGPLNDPDGVLRGIVIVRAPDRGAVDRMFDQDPYVTKGYMKVEPHEASIDYGRIVVKVTPEALEEFRIVILSDPKELEDAKKEPFRGQADYVANLAREGSILVSATFAGKGGRRSAWVARVHNDMKRLVQAAPDVADGGLEYQILPLYLGRGSLERAVR